MLSLIVAIDEQNGIGKENNLLCYLPADLKQFKQRTTGHAIVMGRNTFDSLPNGPLPNRKNIVVSATMPEKEGIIVCRSLDDALETLSLSDDEAFIIGGEMLYRAALPMVEKMYVTHIHHAFEADRFFPNIDSKEWEIVERVDYPMDEKNKFPFTVCTYVRRK